MPGTFHCRSNGVIVNLTPPPGPRGSLLWLPEGERRMECAGILSEFALATTTGFPILEVHDRFVMPIDEVRP